MSFSTANVPIGGPYTATFAISAPNIAPQTVTVQLTITAPPPSPFPIGPQDIPCPAGAFDLYPGYDIQNVVANAAGTTTFCLRAGLYAVNSPIVPKSGNTFIGEYGAILDGTGWVTDDVNAAAFQSPDQDIDDVTIKNLVIRNMPERAIHASYIGSRNWTIVNNELANNDIGVAAPNDSRVANNYVHHNKTGGYSAFKSANVVFENNEFAYNGKHKLVAATNAWFINNFVHHSNDDGIWYDGSCVGGIVTGNIVEDNGRDGISIEVSSGVVVHDNIVRRNANSGIFISMSQNVEAYSNTLSGNFRAIQYFVNCDALPDGRDLANNVVRDNRITVGTEAGALASTLTHLGSCTPTQVEPYLNGSKNNQFLRNNYSVPSLATKYFVWGFGSAGLKSWSEWQALGNDTTGTYLRY